MKILIVLVFIFFGISAENIAKENPRVFVFTDINIDSGDPDDRQSLVHLLWYANELEIEGIVPERWSASGLKACQLVLDAYIADYSAYDLKKKKYPKPQELEATFATNRSHANELFIKAASETERPLYVLVWGNMEGLKEILFQEPKLSKNIRVISIGTGVMLESNIQFIPENWEKSPPCKQMNWNGGGRNDIFNDPRFHDMWWLEMNWTYEGMFSGPEPALMLEKLSKFGTMGKHLKEVVKKEAWAQYFRVGDTPTVLYVIDNEHNPDNPEKSSWAGKFVKPLPEVRPNYYADFNGNLDWDYANPCNTWENHEQMRDIAAHTLEEKREEMYEATLRKLKNVYDIE